MTIDIKQSPATVADLLALVIDGNEIVFEDDGRALARLSPISEASRPRVAGLAGSAKISTIRCLMNSGMGAYETTA